MNPDARGEVKAIVLDVRPVLAAGGDPYQEIIAAADRALPGQAIVIVNSFEPFPLYTQLGARGFEHVTERLPDGDWKVTFRRS